MGNKEESTSTATMQSTSYRNHNHPVVSASAPTTTTSTTTPLAIPCRGMALALEEAWSLSSRHNSCGERRRNGGGGGGGVLDNPEMKMQVMMLMSQVSIVPSGS